MEVVFTMTPNKDVGSDKREVRRKAIHVRNEMASADVARWSRDIAHQFLTYIPYQDHHCFSGYWPIGNEVDPRGLMGRLIDAGLGGSLPVVVGKASPLRFYGWGSDDDLEDGVFGTKEPKRKDEVEPTLILLPLLGFSRSGHRLGFGAGYYDRTLNALRKERSVLAVGLAFSAQALQDLPVEPHDEVLDWIVTETQAIQIQ